MKAQKLLIANRGEIAIRIAHAAAELGISTVAVYAEDDANCLHVQKADEAVLLNGRFPYLDIPQLVQVAVDNGCTMLHPGYGFLSEQPRFAFACERAGITFVGPTPETLARCGNKLAARELAVAHGVPIIDGGDDNDKDGAAHFLQTAAGKNGIMIKAVAGGGGRGMRIVTEIEQLDDAWARCRSEAKRAFGDDALYFEPYLPHARHVEVQIVGDGKGNVTALWERGCSIQRQQQKIVEFAPAPGMSDGLRRRLMKAAVSMAQALNYRSLGTFEFLVEGSDLSEDVPFYFMEANPRLQVEHTVTEQITGLDLVQIQLAIANGRSLPDLNLTQAQLPPPGGLAVQLRINAETIAPNGQAVPSSGTIRQLNLPFGVGVRIDSHAAAGYAPPPAYDSLLAKLICTVRGDIEQEEGFARLVRKASRVLAETQIDGIETNLPFLRRLLAHPDFVPEKLHTRFVADNLTDLTVADAQPALHTPHQNGLLPVFAPMAGTVLAIDVTEGETVAQGQQLGVVEAMKMEAVLAAPQGGTVTQILAAVGEIVGVERPFLTLDPTDNQAAIAETATEHDLDDIRPDLAALFERRKFLYDENRPEAVEKRHGRGQRTARENIADLCDTDSFIEVGSALVAAQRTRRPLNDLIERTPADGLITGYGAVNGDLFDAETAQCLVMAYDYTVLAGTQGYLNHKKMDRLLKLAGRGKRPLILFAEGGGGRPGDVDFVGVAQLDVMTFSLFAKLSGQIPLITIVSGYCFAGNAALAGCADVLIATENSAIGMGGPAMIEGGGLGRFHPREVGPASVQSKNGVIDILVKDEAEAVAAAKQYLSYFQGSLPEWTCADQRLLRRAIPENRRRIYDMRQLIATLADDGSVLELRPEFGQGMITALMRVEGRPFGLIANDPAHLGGAITADGADKAARLMQLCEAHGLPLLSLVDTPGIMVGPEAEKSGTVRHAARLFVVGASLTIPVFAIVVRKGYGLGAQAMCAGSFHVPFFTLAWPTGEFGAMGLEGAVRLGFRKELEAAESEEARQALFEQMVAQAYETGKALNMASFMEIDEVIDPLETRQRIVAGLKSAHGGGGERPFIDTW